MAIPKSVANGLISGVVGELVMQALFALFQPFLVQRMKS